jgi:predicted AAA+ superfamily ATPase
MLQKRLETENGFYFSADHPIIRANWLLYFVMYCVVEKWVKTIFIDEIFRYENWREELKNIIDSFDINIYFSGSSSMAVYDWVIDLWRRVDEYKVNTLSFREFIKLKYKVDLPKITFQELIINHENISVYYAIKLKQTNFEEYR